MDAASDKGIDFFVSRAGPDAEIATQVAHILESAGKRVIIQDWDFKNRSFMERMQAALTSGARVIALLSPDYLNRDHCAAEWQNTIADDPLNRQSRLIVFRIRICAPVGLLKSLAYCDLVPLLANPVTSGTMLRDVVLAAVQPGRDKRPPEDFSKLFYQAQPILHSEIRPTPSFTGREDELFKIGKALSLGVQAVITQPAAVHGLGGIGKSALVREYALRAQEDYTGIWWLNAEKAKETDTWDGIERGLVALRTLLYPGTGEPQDRAQAAREMLSFLSAHGSEKPWLLIYDNVDDARVLKAWPPPNNVQVLITSRLGNWRREIASIDVSVWSPNETVRYLQQESGREDLAEADAQRIAEALGCLPLALSHAAAYLRDVDNATPDSYLAALSEHMKDVPESADYPRAVFATLMENTRQAEARAPGAMAILSLAAFYAPDGIPEELFQQAAEHYPPELAAVIGKTVSLEKAIGALDRLSVVEFRRETRTFSVQRLVQAAARDSLGSDGATWAASAVQACGAADPGVDFKHWQAFERLLPHARIAAALAGDDVGLPLALALNQAGCYLQERASYAEAEPLYKRSFSIYEKALGPDHPDVGTSLNNLALLYHAQGKYDLAEPLYKRSLSIREKALGPDHPDVGTSLNNLALLYHAQGKYDLAEPLYKRSLSIYEKALGPDHPDVGNALNNLALLYHAQGKYDLAEPLYKRSIPISEKALGPDHPDVGTSLNNLAALYKAQGKYDLAEPLYKRSIPISEKALGPDHPDVGTSLNNLAELYHAQGKYDLAEPLSKRSLSIREKALGSDHPDVGTSLNNLALLYHAQGKYDLAEPHYKRSLSIYEKALGPDHPDVGTSLNNLAALYKAQGKYDLAEPLYKRSLSIREKALGPDHPSVGASLNNLAELYRAQGKYDLAEPLYKRSIPIFEKALGPDHPDVGTSLNNLALLYDAQGKYDLAEPLYKRSLSIREKGAG